MITFNVQKMKNKKDVHYNHVCATDLCHSFKIYLIAHNIDIGETEEREM